MTHTNRTAVILRPSEITPRERGGGGGIVHGRGRRRGERRDGGRTPRGVRQATHFSAASRSRAACAASDFG